MFDLACFGGVTIFHALRTEGKVAPSVLSSVHVRCVDMEMAALPEKESDLLAFEKNTRAMSDSLMLYMGAIDTAWAIEPNHERISTSSFRVLQVLDDMRSLAEV